MLLTRAARFFRLRWVKIFGRRLACVWASLILSRLQIPEFVHHSASWVLSSTGSSSWVFHLRIRLVTFGVVRCILLIDLLLVVHKHVLNLSLKPLKKYNVFLIGNVLEFLILLLILVLRFLERPGLFGNTDVVARILLDFSSRGWRQRSSLL